MRLNEVNKVIKNFRAKLLQTMALTLFCANIAYADNPKIAWFWSNPDSGFWPVVERFVSAAAKDLGVDIEIFTYGDNPMMVVPTVEKVLSQASTRPDAIMFHNYKNTGKEILELCEKNKIPAFIFNAGFPPENNIGNPREKYKYWIGLMLPDDEYAGYILAKRLMEEARTINKRGKDGKIHVVALEGNRTSEASNARVRGFNRAISEDPDFVIEQFFHSKWWERLAFEAFELSIIRYPDVSMFWAASDSMAIGVIKAAKEHAWVPGKDFVTGGVDLLPDDLDYLKSGEMSVSVGGHYAEGAWATILLYDYLKGYDFADNESTVFSTRMGDFTTSDILESGDLGQKLSKAHIEKTDFRRFSRAYNPDLKSYNFDFKELFK
jgi:ABC-type sugar transport system substrate-binding protein